MSVAETLVAVVAGRERAVVLTVVEGPFAGARCIWRPDRPLVGEDPLQAAATAAVVLERGRSRVLALPEGRVLAEVYGPPPRLIVVGAYDLGEQLCAGAHALGWRTAVVDARSAYATPERLPSADEIVVAWPQEALARLAPDASAAIVVLTHDDKFDVPALMAALASPAFYVGALGSRRNQQRRRERLREAGATDEQLDRICGPCGLDLGGESTAETALSILAEVLARRNGRTGGPLGAGDGAIHGEAG